MGTFDDLIPEDAVESTGAFDDLVPKNPVKRNAFAYANDTMIDIANSASGLAKAGVDLVAPDSAASGAIGEFIKKGEANQSDWKQRSRSTLQGDLKAADGEWNKAGTYIKHAVTKDPLGTVAQIAGNVAPFGIAGNLLAHFGAVARTAATMGLASGLTVGEVRGNIFNKIENTPDVDLIANSPEYASLRKTMSEKEAKSEVGASILNNIPELAIAGTVGALGGKYGLEGMMTGVAPKFGGRIASGVVGVVDEATQGATEQLASNYGVRRILPNQSMTEDVGLNAAAEGILGVGAAARPLGVEHAPPTSQPKTTPTTPIISDAIKKLDASATADEAIAAANEIVDAPLDNVFTEQLRTQSSANQSSINELDGLIASERRDKAERLRAEMARLTGQRNQSAIDGHLSTEEAADYLARSALHLPSPEDSPAGAVMRVNPSGDVAPETFAQRAEIPEPFSLTGQQDEPAARIAGRAVTEISDKALSTYAKSAGSAGIAARAEMERRAAPMAPLTPSLMAQATTLETPAGQQSANTTGQEAAPLDDLALRLRAKAISAKAGFNDVSNNEQMRNIAFGGAGTLSRGSKNKMRAWSNKMDGVATKSIAANFLANVAEGEALNLNEINRIFVTVATRQEMDETESMRRNWTMMTSGDYETLARKIMAHADKRYAQKMPIKLDMGYNNIVTLNPRAMHPAAPLPEQGAPGADIQPTAQPVAPAAHISPTPMSETSANPLNQQPVVAPRFEKQKDGTVRVFGFAKDQIVAAREKIGANRAIVGNNGNAIFPSGTSVVALKRVLGIDDLPAGTILGKGDKPFSKGEAKMRLNADKALKKTHEVVQVEDGWGIAPKQPKQKSEPVPKKRMAINPESHTLLQAMAIIGVDPADPLANDLRRSLGLADGKNLRVSLPGSMPLWLFRKGGQRLDAIAGDLSQDGQKYLDAHDRQEMLNKLYDNPDYRTPEGEARAAQRKRETTHAEQQATAVERQESVIAARTALDEASEAELEWMVEHDGDILSQEEADNFNAEYAAHQEEEHDQQRAAEAVAGHDTGEPQADRPAGAQDNQGTQGAEFQLAGQTEAEIAAAARAKHDAEMADIQADINERRQKTQDDEAQIAKTNTANGNAAASYSLIQPEQVSRAQNNKLKKDKAKAELSGQTDLLSQQSAITAPLTKEADNESQQDTYGERFTIDLGEMFGKVPYRASNVSDVPEGHTVLSSEIIVRKTKISKRDQQDYRLPATVNAWRVSAVRNNGGGIYAQIEAMTQDFGRTPDGEVVGYFTVLNGHATDAVARIAPSINNAAIRAYEKATNLFTEPEQVSTPEQSKQSAIESIKQSDDIPTADKIRLAAELRNGGVTAEDVAAIVGDVSTNPEKVNTSQEHVQKTAESEQVEPAKEGKSEEANYADHIHTLAVQSDLFNRIREGDVTADEFKASFDSLLKNKEGITAELNGMTKAGIFSKFPGLEYRYKSEVKSRAVDAAYRDMIADFTLGEAYSYGMSSGSMVDSVRAMVEKTTDETLAAYADGIKQKRAEREARNHEALAGMDNPQTLEDYQRIMSAKAQEIGEGATFLQARMAMTPEQRAKFDELAAEKSRGERASRKEAQQEQSIRAPGEAVETTEIIKTKHTKHGHDLWQFQMVKRVAPEEFKSLVAQAKRLGGDYSSYRGNGAIPGWQFRTEEAAKAFKALVAGDTAQAKDVMSARRDAFADDRSQSAVERLTEMADALEEKADASLGQERKANTSRRARFAASAEAAANHDKAMAQTMLNIAQAIGNGTAKFLDRIRQKVQVEMLSGFIRTAQDDMHRKLYETYAEQEKHKGEKPTAEVADYATFPNYTAFRSDLASLGRALLETEGTKKLGQRLMKVADDVSDAYLSFAKENLHKVSTFSKTGGGGAVFASKAEAEAVIARSGFNGQAIVLPFKRGQNIIIQSPSEAIKRGIWQGDNDKRITLSGDFGVELVEAIGKASRRGARVSVPWQFENAYDKRKRLSAMGIETPAELRAALREFIGLKEAPREADKIKEMERAMIGRKNDGLDFFPTPSATADEMIETADIKEGMSVLEPSAGMGHIAERIREAGVDPDVVELSNERKELLEAKGFNVVGRDFMDTEGSYDRIIMNPPFSDGRAAQHVQHAYDLLKPGGRLVALVDEGVFFRGDKKAQAFRDWLEQVGATDEKLEEGTFNDPSLPVNTSVNARMLVITKETDKGVALLSLSPRVNAGPGVSLATADAVVRRVVAAKKSWNVEIGTFATFDALPSAVQEAAIKDYGEKEARQAKGIVHDGKVYIVADNNESEADVESTVLHEVEGHVGIHRLYGKEIVNKLNLLFLQIGGREGLKRIVKQRGIVEDIGGYALALDKKEHLTDDQKISVMMDEVLAHYAQDPKFSDRIKAIVGMIRAKLREWGFKHFEEYGETDLLHILKQGRAQLKTNKNGAGGVTSLMVAWHGSPHDHDKFDSSKIGTGEGAAAYGHGHYFASAREVAEYYRKALTGDGFGYRRENGETFKAGMERGAPELAATAMLDNNGDKSAAIDSLNAQKDFSTRPQDYHAAMRFIESGKELPAIEKNKGRLYQVELAPSEDEYLDWDKPLSEQSEKVKAAIKELGYEPDAKAAISKFAADNNMPHDEALDFINHNVALDANMRGEELYQKLAGGNAKGHNAKMASQWLHDAGIRGIRYLDGSSRSAGEGSHNFVIFDDADVEIKAKFSRRIHGDRPSVQDYIVPETPEFDGNMSGDLAYTPKSAEKKGIEQLPIRLTVGAARERHRGFGIMHMADNASRDESRKAPAYTDDDAENFARHVAAIARSFNTIYHEHGDRYILSANNMVDALVVEKRKDADTGENFYSAVTFVPTKNRYVWGKPAWAGRAVFPDDRLLQSSASTPSSDQESQQPDRQPQRNQTSHFDLTQVDADRQPKNKTTVTQKKRRAYTMNSIVSNAVADNAGLPISRIQAIVDQIVAKLPRLEGGVHVVQSVSELPEGGLHSDIEGVYYTGTDDIYIVADNIHTESRLRKVVAHEAFHLASEEMLNAVDPKLWGKLVNQVTTLEQTGNKLIRRLGKTVNERQPGLSKTNRVKEILALMAEDDVQNNPLFVGTARSTFQRFIDGIKAFMKLVFDVQMTDKEVLEIVKMAERHLGEKAGTSSVVTGMKVAMNSRNIERVAFIGDELGGYEQPIQQLKLKAREFARSHFADKTVIVKDDGAEILIPWQGIKHSFSGNISKVAAIVSTKLDKLIEAGRRVESHPDKSGRDNIVAVHYYDTSVMIGEEDAVIRIVVRETASGKRFYDHFESRDKAPVRGSENLTGEFPGNSAQPDTGATSNIAEIRNANQDIRSSAWKMLSGDMAMFQNPTPDSFEMEQGAREIDPGMKAVEDRPDLDEEKTGMTRKWYVTMPDKTHAWVYENKKGEVWLNASDLAEGVSGGTKLYLLVGNYAEANGKVFIGDPAGLSDVALIRRTENMLSLALRFGSTKFLEPHEYQMNPEAKHGTVLADIARPITWVHGDDENNLNELLKTSYDNTVNLFPEIKNVTYNFDKQRFEKAGSEFTDFDGIIERGIGALRQRGLAKIISSRKPGGTQGKAKDQPPIGSATLKRAALTNTLSRATREGRGRDLLAEISRIVPGGLRGTPLQGILYSRKGGGSTWEAPEISRMDSLIYTLQDKHIDLKKISEAIKKTGKDIADGINAYLQEELYHGRTATRVKQFIQSELDPLIADMRMRGVKMADFEEYLWMRHVEERNAQIAKVNPDMPDGGSGVSTGEAKDYLANLPADKRRAYEALAKRVDSINTKTRQTLVAYGLESQDTIDAWGRAYQHYVPLMREGMEHEFGNGTGQGFSVRGNASKRATGSNRAVVDILANIAQQREKAIIRGEKNRVSTALLGLAALNPNPEFWKVDEPPTVRTVNGRTGLVEERTDPLYKSRDNVIVSRVPDGQGGIIERAVVFNEHDERAMRMARSLKNLDQDQIGELLGTASAITRYFASINTQYNPIFGVLNLTRDVQGALLNLSSTPIAGKQKEVLGHTVSALKGIYADIRDHRKGVAPSSKWAQLWEEFQREGGQTGYRDMFKNARDRAEALETALDPDWWQKTRWGKTLTLNGFLSAPEKMLADKAVRPVFEWLSDYNETMENAVRLAAYKTAKENGMSNQQAASLAKNLTVNFNRKGEMGRQIGSLYAFFNASVQGTARLAETLKGPAGKRIVYGGVLLGAMQAMALAMAGMDDDEPPEFVRDRSIIIPTGDGKYISIPMPLGFNILPNFGRIATEFVLSGFRDPQKRIVHLMGVVADAFNPIGNAGLSMQTIAPTVLDPLAALAENKDWTGRPIAREDFNSRNPTPGFTRAKDTASVFSKVLSEAANLITGGTDFKPGAVSPTPDQIDYLISQAFGGVGREYLKVEQSVTSLYTGEDLPMHKVPLVGRFYGDTTGQSSQGGAFYANLKAINEHEAEIKGRRKTGGNVLEYMRENPEAHLVGMANKAERQVSELRQQKRMMLERGDSQERIKLIEMRITETMRKLNERVKSMREAA